MEETKNATVSEEQTTAKPVVTEKKVNRIFLEILVMGVEENKSKIKKMLDAIQEQLTDRKARRRARVLWYIDKGEKTNEEKKQWLIENSNAKYIVFAGEDEKYFVDKKFVSNTLTKIKRLEDAHASLKASGIKYTPPKKNEQEVEENKDATSEETKIVELNPKKQENEN